ncbi:MAG: xylose isomerase [Opitutae bacterium]|nr:xylose isomerase [Opitutae bacterium]|tara:strand:+ start:474 stop:1574 length:1101 start_codon:yes stop_codon:yes gene_type:complete
MTIAHPTIPRRAFLRDCGLAASIANVLPSNLLAQEKKNKVKLGFDNFSIRALGWKAPRLLQYAAKQKVDTILFSDLDVYETHDEGYLKEIRQEASKLGIEIHAGTGGICPTSPKFIDKYGSAEDHLRRTIRVANAVGSPVARCYLGSSKDRLGEGGIQRHIKSTIQVCKKVRKDALDAGVMIAIENHAGDMHSRELVGLIEKAGPDYVGATLDSGNATWTLEDPLDTLENLAPFAVSSGIRDSMIWEIDQGAAVQWTAMGEGCVDMKTFAAKWMKLCPNVPIQLEIISGFSKPFPYLEQDFWKPYSSIRADEFANFVRLAKKGTSIESFKVAKGIDRKKAQQEYQVAELERSIKYCKETLSLGQRS